jgi:hypothetical protein
VDFQFREFARDIDRGRRSQTAQDFKWTGEIELRDPGKITKPTLKSAMRIPKDLPANILHDGAPEARSQLEKLLRRLLEMGSKRRFARPRILARAIQCNLVYVLA